MNNIASTARSAVIEIGRVLNRFVPRLEDKSKGRFYYGVNDRMPQEMIEMISCNPTALRAILKRAEFIAANGFVNDKLNDYVVTKGKTARKLLMETAIQVSFFECLSWHIARYPDGKVSSVNMLPYEMIRRRLDGDLDYNKTLASSEEKKSNADYIKYPAFGTVKKFEGGYKGEILYDWIKTPIAHNHPVASWFAGEMDVRTGAEYAAMDLELVINGFMTSAMLTIIGHVDGEQKDKDGLTAVDHLRNDLARWTSKSKNKTTGLSDRSSIFIRFAETKEQVPDLQAFDSEKIISASIEKRESIDKAVCRIFNVNPVILDHDVTSLLGQDNAMKNAMRNQATTVISFQNLIKENFEKVFPDADGPETKWDISTLDPYKQVVEKDANQKILDTLIAMPPLMSAEIIRAMPPEQLLNLIGMKGVKLDATDRPE